MRKILILAIFGLMFAVTQASDTGYSPDVGYELSFTQAQTPVVMPAIMPCMQIELAQANSVMTYPPKNIIVCPNTEYICAYHNPDYGLKNKYKMNLLISMTTGNKQDELVTTRHVI
mgnify:CR=1 FL=1